MNISVAAQRSGVSAKTIRYYESIALIPSAERSANGYRAYSESEVHTLRFIRRARRLNFSAEEIRSLLDLWRDTRRSSNKVKVLASQHLTELDRKIAELEAMRRTLAQVIERCHGGDRPDCAILDDLACDAEA